MANILKIITYVCTLCCTCRLFAADTNSKIQITQAKLKNGVTVIMVPDNRYKLIDFRVIVLAGGSSELEDKSGAAHYLEHLMFSGRKFQPKYQEHLKFRKRNSIYSNAFTSYDSTCYIYNDIQSDKFGTLIDLEILRFQPPKVDKATESHELSVVLEERSMRVSSEPLQNLLLDAVSILLRGTKYSIPLLGKTSDLSKLKASDSAQFYKDNYIPENLTLLIVGDFNQEAVIKKLEETFGKISGKKPVFGNATSQEMTSRKIYLKHNATQKIPTNVVMLWRNGPSAKGSFDEYVAFDIIKSILNNINGELYKHFVIEKKLATKIEIDAVSVGVAYYCPVVYAVLNENVDEYDFEKEFVNFIKSLSERGLDEKQFISAQKGAVIGHAYAVESTTSITEALTGLITMRVDPVKFNDIAGICNSLTIRYANKVFRKYLSQPADLIAVLKGE